MSRRRLRFHLIISQNPHAVDIVHEDDVTIDEDDEKKCKFNWKRTPSADSEEIIGEILEKGTKVDLLKLKPDKPEHRKRELEKIKSKEANAKNDELQSVSEKMVETGPDSICQPGPSKKQRTSAISLSPRQYQELERKLELLECYEDHSKNPAMAELITGRKIYVDALDKGLIQQTYQLNLSVHFSKVIGLLVPDDILRHRGLSARGKMGHIAFPPELIKIANAYVIFCYKQAKGDPQKIVNFKPYQVIKNMINNARKDKEKTRSTPTVASASPTASSSTSSPSPTPSSLPHLSLTPLTPPSPTASTSGSAGSNSDLNLYNMINGTDHDYIDMEHGTDQQFIDMNVLRNPNKAREVIIPNHQLT